MKPVMWRRDLVFSIGMALAVVLAGAGAMVDHAILQPRVKQPESPRVWIEFENVQHALDVAGMLGGSQRGLTVCVNSPIVERIWVPPYVQLSGKPEECRYRTRIEQLVEWTHDNEISGVTFQQGTVPQDSPIWRTVVEAKKDARLTITWPNGVTVTQPER